jgi:hypothetical protein
MHYFPCFPHIELLLASFPKLEHGPLMIDSPLLEFIESFNFIISDLPHFFGLIFVHEIAVLTHFRIVISALLLFVHSYHAGQVFILQSGQ